MVLAISSILESIPLAMTPMYELNRVIRRASQSKSLPLEAFAFQIAFQRLPLFKRSLLVVRQISVFRRPAVRRRQIELLPVVHPQFCDSHLIALNNLLASIARKAVGERFERVSNS